ncbi:MAG: hypothetical protein Q9212_005081 [Teloschistes hypoglaucus]
MSKGCRVKGHPNDIYGPVVDYLESALAHWRPDANQEPRIHYHLGYSRVVSPMMMVHVVELPSTRAPPGSNNDGKSPDKESPVKAITMLENNFEASSSAIELTGPINADNANHPSSSQTSPSQLYYDHHSEVTPPLMISAGNPENNSQSADLTMVTQQMSPGDISDGQPTHSLFPPSSSNTSFLTTNPADSLEHSQQTGSESLSSVPTEVNRRLKAVLLGTEIKGPYSMITSGGGSSTTGSRRSRRSDLATSSDFFRQNRFERKSDYLRNDGGSIHRDRRQYESKVVVALTNQEQDWGRSQSEDENENEVEGYSSDDDDDENGGVAL